MAPPPPTTRPPLELYRVAWVFYLVLAIVSVVWIGLRENGLGWGLLLKADQPWPGQLQQAATDLGLGLALAGVTVVSWDLAERWSASAAALGAHLRAMLGPLSRGEAIGVALLSGLSEELFFRGALQGAISGWRGWLIATVVFALLHSGPGKPSRWWTVFAALAGGSMGAIVLWRGTLTAAIAAHVAINAVQLTRAVGRPAVGPESHLAGEGKEPQEPPDDQLQ